MEEIRCIALLNNELGTVAIPGSVAEQLFVNRYVTNRIPPVKHRWQAEGLLLVIWAGTLHHR
jgi:hypothetical protein